MSLPTLRPRGEFNRLRKPAPPKKPYRHEGEDWLFKKGTKQGAPIGGTMRLSNEPGGFGIVVKITATAGGKKIRAIVGHLSRGAIKFGASKKVAPGDYIGLSGNSGNASSLKVAEHHTHLQIEIDGKPVKPSRTHLLNLAHPR